MAFRNIFVSSPSYLYIDKNRLCIKQEFDQTKFDIEDINSLVLESRDSTISVYTLSQLAQYQVCVFVCNARHSPSGVLLPFCSHSRHLKALKSQINMTQEFKDSLWQAIIKNKLQNQAKVLQLFSKDKADYIFDLSNKVQPGDQTHTEANAASVYFEQLFGVGFARHQDNFINAALDYGYAILRGLISRTIVAYGYEPCIGIWHKSELNAFNLADDMIEPFRPFVDQFVFSMVERHQDFDVQAKRQLFAIVDSSVTVDEKKYNLNNAIDKVIIGLNQSIVNSTVILPHVKLTPIERFKFL